MIKIDALKNNTPLLSKIENVLSDEAYRVAAYARVSTDKDDQANSFESQKKYFEEYIANQDDCELVEIYSDEGITGTMTNNRNGFNRMISDAMSGKIDYIITKEVSRFARNTVDVLKITRELKEIGVGVYFAIDNINTLDSDGELRLSLMASLAQEESRKTSERVKWGQKRQMEKGVVFGRRMLGYDVKEGKLILIEEEKPIVQLIFHKYLNEGKGTHIIARELKEAGIKPLDPDGTSKYKNDWSNTVILRILRNEKYVGDLCQKKTYTKNYLDHKKRYNRGEEDMVYIKDHHPEIAIISREMWDATQEELKRRSPSDEQKAKHSNRYWASGKVFCGVCGARFVNKIKKTSAGSSKAWNCLNHVKASAFRNAECSMSEWASDRSLKNIVLYILNTLVSDTKGVKEEIIQELSGMSWVEKEVSVEDIEQKLNHLNKKSSKLLDLRLEEEISKEEFKEKKAKIDAEIAELTSNLNAIKDADKDMQIKVDKMAKMIDYVDELLSLNGENVDGILGAVTETITVFENHTVVVKLKDIPLRFRVEYKSTGRLSTYRTEILSLEVV